MLSDSAGSMQVSTRLGPVKGSIGGSPGKGPASTTHSRLDSRPDSYGGSGVERPEPARPSTLGSSRKQRAGDTNDRPTPNLERGSGRTKFPTTLTPHLGPLHGDPQLTFLFVSPNPPLHPEARLVLFLRVPSSTAAMRHALECRKPHTEISALCPCRPPPAERGRFLRVTQRYPRYPRYRP